MRQIQKKQLLIISIALVLILGSALIFFLRIHPKKQIVDVVEKQKPRVSLPTTFQRDPFFEKFALKDAVPSTNQLTHLEESYPTGLPQQFPPPQSTATGTLVVTADTDNVRIIITTKDPGDANLNEQHQYQSPANSAPVQIVLPTNYYT